MVILSSPQHGSKRDSVYLGVSQSFLKGVRKGAGKVKYTQKVSKLEWHIKEEVKKENLLPLVIAQKPSTGLSQLALSSQCLY